MIAIQYQQDTYYDETEIQHCWYAIDSGTRIGELYVAIDTEIISNIEVSEDHRGKGIARSLYEAADQMLDHLKHAPAGGCTPEGLAFAQAVGGEVADDMDELKDLHEALAAVDDEDDYCLSDDYSDYSDYNF